MKDKAIVSTFTLAVSLASYYYAKHGAKDTVPYTMIGGFLGAVIGELIVGAIRISKNASRNNE